MLEWKNFNPDTIGCKNCLEIGTHYLFAIELSTSEYFIFFGAIIESYDIPNMLKLVDQDGDDIGYNIEDVNYYSEINKPSKANRDANK